MNTYVIELNKGSDNQAVCFCRTCCKRIEGTEDAIKITKFPNNVNTFCCSLICADMHILSEI